MTSDKPLGINELIQLELESEHPSEWRLQRLKGIAQREFDFMVATGGEVPSTYPDVVKAFEEYSTLPDYKPEHAKEARVKELEERFSVRHEADGSYTIHPKGAPFCPN